MRQFLSFFRSKTPRRLSSLDAYALWSAAYPPDAHNPLMETEQRAMLAMLPDLHGKTVLDLACGSGRYAAIARNSGAAQVYGFDNSLPMLRAGAIERPAVAELDTIPLCDACIDVVICALAIGHLPSIEPTMREINRVLRIGGIALISDFHPFQYLKGARRTFAVGRDLYEVEHYVHLYSDIHRVAGNSGLRIDAIAEPVIADRGPVVLALRLVKGL
jgi:malonyl-CoA O-methyltransferase